MRELTIQFVRSISASFYILSLCGLVFGIGVFPSGCHRPRNSWDRQKNANVRTAPSVPQVIQSYVTSDFDGFSMGNIYKLANGQMWEQLEPYIWIHIAVMPPVTIWASHGTYKLKVEGIDHAVSVRLLSVPGIREADSEQTAPDLIESRIVSDFDGFDMGNIYKLENGQMWEQIDPRIRVRVRVNPRVTIWKDGSRYMMHVDDVEPVITVRPLTSIGSSPPPDVAESQPAIAIDLLQTIIGSREGRLVANDGTFLGSVTSRFDADSIANEFGQYGSKFSADSILNRFGEFGSRFSTLSPYNKFTATPPMIYVDDKGLIYVTTNESLNPRVHPDVLVGILQK